MNTKTLDKDCRCAACGETMNAGEAFTWHKSKKSVPTFARGAGSGMLTTREVFRPRHVHDCLGAKSRRNLTKRRGTASTRDAALPPNMASPRNG